MRQDHGQYAGATIVVDSGLIGRVGQIGDLQLASAALVRINGDPLKVIVEIKPRSNTKAR
jgi:hypothetical protein